ncbi:hypothetical protein OIU79_008674 [Salix purpurea]|nr:hypothetical protein OIU79_008674 [Salix purpurea]
MELLDLITHRLIIITPEHQQSLSHCHLTMQLGLLYPTGLLVDTNLDTSVPDAYTPPPAPMPFDMAVGRLASNPAWVERDLW